MRSFVLPPRASLFSLIAASALVVLSSARQAPARPQPHPFPDAPTQDAGDGEHDGTTECVLRQVLGLPCNHEEPTETT